MLSLPSCAGAGRGFGNEHVPAGKENMLCTRAASTFCDKGPAVQLGVAR